MGSARTSWPHCAGVRECRGRLSALSKAERVMGDLFYARRRCRHWQRRGPGSPEPLLVRWSIPPPSSIVLGMIDVSAHPILLPVDLGFLSSGQVSAVELPVGADFLVDRGFILLKAGRLACGQ